MSTKVLTFLVIIALEFSSAGGFPVTDSNEVYYEYDSELEMKQENLFQNLLTRVKRSRAFLNPALPGMSSDYYEQRLHRSDIFMFGKYYELDKSLRQNSQDYHAKKITTTTKAPPPPPDARHDPHLHNNTQTSDEFFSQQFYPVLPTTKTPDPPSSEIDDILHHVVTLVYEGSQDRKRRNDEDWTMLPQDTTVPPTASATNV